MKFFLLLAMLVVCASGLQDLTGKMFIFQTETNTDYVKLNFTKQDFEALTVCHRSFTDLKRDHVLFSLDPYYGHISFMVLWNETQQEIMVFVQNEQAAFRGFDYKLNSWHSICTTWDSESGLVQLWFDGQRSVRKLITPGLKISGSPVIFLGQEQYFYGGGSGTIQSFIGMISDVHMWDYNLNPCETQNYMNNQLFTPGNVVNWRALNDEINGNVLTEYKQIICL